MQRTVAVEYGDVSVTLQEENGKTTAWVELPVRNGNFDSNPQGIMLDFWTEDPRVLVDLMGAIQEVLCALDSPEERPDA